MALVGVELQTLVSEPDALTTRPTPCAFIYFNYLLIHFCVLFSFSKSKINLYLFPASHRQC